MSIKAQCSACDAKFNLPDAAAGKSFLCKNCGAKVRVPDPEPAPEADFLSTLPTGFTHTPRQAKKPIPVVPLAIGGGVVLLAILVISLVSLIGGDSTPTQDEATPIAAVPDTPANEPRQRDQPVRVPRQDNPAPRVDRPSPATIVEPEVDTTNPPDTAGPDSNGSVPNPLPAATVNKPDPEELAALARAKQRTALEAFREEYPKQPVALGVKTPPHTPVNPIGTWSVVPDPPAKSYRLGPELELNINDRGAQDIVVPATPSPFIAIGDNKTRSRKRFIVDTRTGKVVWDFVGEYPHTRSVALSPDGLRVALIADSPDGMTQTLVFGFRGTNRRVNIELDAFEGAPPKSDCRVHFINHSQAVLVEVIDQKIDRLTAYDTLKGDVLWQTDGLGGSYRIDTCVAISPGGKLVAVASDGADEINTISFISTENGERVSQLRVPGEARMFSAIAFSPDSERMVALLSNHKHIVAWDLNDGRSISSAAIQGRLSSHGKLDRLSVIGDGLLAIWNGQLVVDTQTGLSYDRPEKKGLSQRKPNPSLMFNGTDYLAISSERSRTNKQVNMLRAGSLDPDALALTFAALSTGGEITEYGLPPIAETHLSARSLGSNYSGFVVDPDRAVSFPLDYQPKPLPTATTETLLIETPEWDGPGRVSTSIDQVTNADASGLALVKLRDSRVFRFSPHRPGVSEQVELPENLKPLWLSPDGRQVLTLCGDYRLDLVDLQSSEILDSWRIRQEQHNGKWATHDKIMDAVLVNGNRLWVIDRGNQLSLIDTETNKLLFSNRKTTLGLKCFTPDNRFLLASSGHRLRLIDATTGIQAAQYDIGEGKVQAAAVSLDGTRAAVLVNNNLLRELLVIDLRQNEVLTRNVIPYRYKESRYYYFDDIQWVDSRFLIGDKFIIDTTTGRPLWRIHGAGGTTFRGVIDGQATWSLAGGMHTSHLVSMALPTQQLMEQMAASPESQTPAPLLIPAGATVQIRVSNARHRKEIEADARAQLEAAGMVVADQAPYTFVVTQRTESERSEVSSSDGERGSIKEYKEYTDLQWLDDRNKMIWERKQFAYRSVGMNSTSRTFYNVEKGTSLIGLQQREINERLANDGPKKVEVPTRLPAFIDEAMLAEFWVTKDGFKPYVPPPKQ